MLKKVIDFVLNYGIVIVIGSAIAYSFYWFYFIK